MDGGMTDGPPASGRTHNDRPEGLIDRLLAILSEITVEVPSLKTDQFHADLQSCRKKIAASFGTPDFAQHSAECLEICEEYFYRSRVYLAERESAVGEVIQVLREPIGMLSKEAGSFNSQLERTHERFDRLTEIQDIQKLRRQIALECQEFRRIVEEKHRRDEASYSQLESSIEHLQGSLEQTHEEASIDSLTRVANRASFDKSLQRWIEAHNAAKKPFILALLDLDDFKSINDEHGHQVGDRVLHSAAQWFRKGVRTNDFLARFGGEEFAILLSDVTVEQAFHKFEGLLQNIATASYKYNVAGDVATISFTVSCGVAEFVPEENAETLVRRTDAALYEAKHAGKNRVVLAEPPQKSRSLFNSLQPLISFKI
jgi:diguanylate cyclase